MYLEEREVAGERRLGIVLDDGRWLMLRRNPGIEPAAWQSYRTATPGAMMSDTASAHAALAAVIEAAGPDRVTYVWDARLHGPSTDVESGPDVLAVIALVTRSTAAERDRVLQVIAEHYFGGR